MVQLLLHKNDMFTPNCYLQIQGRHSLRSQCNIIGLKIFWNIHCLKRRDRSLSRIDKIESPLHHFFNANLLRRASLKEESR